MGLGQDNGQSWSWNKKGKKAASPSGIQALRGLYTLSVLAKEKG